MLDSLFVVIIRAEDILKVLAFYRDVLGMPVVSAVEGRLYQVDAGNIHIEIAGGGKAKPAPTDRAQAAVTPVFAVKDCEAAVAAVTAAGATLVNAPFSIATAKVAYVADPEGNVVGLREALTPAH